jgi:hypothetical protein
MNKKFSFCCHGFAALVVVLCALTTGCSKKSDAPAATAPVTTDATPAPADASQPASPPANLSSVNGQIAEANAALQAKDYVRAAEALTITPQSPGPQTSEQVIAFNKLKGAVQSQMIAAAAAGDPQAKAALDKLRLDAMYHH